MKELRYVFSCPSSGRPYYRGDLFDFRTEDNACVVFDGQQVVYASESERYTKVKHDFVSPIWALKSFAKHNQVGGDVNIVPFMQDYVCHDHHLSHIYEAFYQSGFSDAAVLVNDGHGTSDDCVTLAYMQEGCEPLLLKRFEEKNSPCDLYRIASKEIFGRNHTEGKFMGLAAYGSNNGRDYIKWNDKTSLIETNLPQLIEDVNGIKSGPADKNLTVMDCKDVAFTVQKNFEDTLVEVVKHFRDLLESRKIETENLCFSGGGILNCPANSRIINLNLFKHYFASPQPSDGCAESIGRAFRNMEGKGEKLHSQRLTSAYLGAIYSESDLPNPRVRFDNCNLEIASHLKGGGVVAWCQDGAEYGPRALGHRSFLADPTSKRMLDALNKIKGRENWRPLAPIVADRLFPLIFEETNTDMCEFMLRTLEIKDKWKGTLQAVCHKDGTTRPQILKRCANPELYDLLMLYFEETGVPCLINTSLNINGFPIVEIPSDLCNLIEEIEFMEDVPEVKAVFVEKGSFYEVLPAPRDGCEITGGFWSSEPQKMNNEREN